MIYDKAGGHYSLIFSGMVYTVKNLPAGYELYQRARAKNAFTKIQVSAHYPRSSFGGLILTDL